MLPIRHITEICDVVLPDGIIGPCAPQAAVAGECKATFMKIPQVDFPRLVKRLRVKWRRLTHGTTRAAGVAICLPVLCAVVVAGSQVMPFVSVRDPSAKTPADAPKEEVSAAVDSSARELSSVDYNESWRQAGTNWNRLGDVDRRHQVLVDANGQLRGRLTTFADWRGDVEPLADAAVHLMQNGRVAAEATTDEDGRFLVSGLSDGTYSLIAESPDGLLAYALHLRKAAPAEVAPEMQLQSMATAPWDTNVVLERVRGYWDSEPPIERTREPNLETIPPPVRLIPQEGVSATTVALHSVRLQDDGRLIGRLRRLHPVTGRPIVAQEIEVALYRNGTLQALTWTDDIGYFEVPYVAPGVYSLVATGSVKPDPTSTSIPGERHGLQQGFMALGIQVLAADDAQVLQVAANTATRLEIDAALVDVADLAPFLGSPVSLATAGGAASLGLTGAQSGSAAAGGAAAAGNFGAWLAAGATAGLAGLVLDDVISNSQP